jgi:hypothetical protein
MRGELTTGANHIGDTWVVICSEYALNGIVGETEETIHRHGYLPIHAHWIDAYSSTFHLFRIAKATRRTYMYNSRLSVSTSAPVAGTDYNGTASTSISDLVNNFFPKTFSVKSSLSLCHFVTAFFISRNQ